MSEQSYKGTAAVFTSLPRPWGSFMHTWKDLTAFLLELVAPAEKKRAARAPMMVILRNMFVTEAGRMQCIEIIEKLKSRLYEKIWKEKGYKYICSCKSSLRSLATVAPPGLEPTTMKPQKDLSVLRDPPQMRWSG